MYDEDGTLALPSLGRKSWKKADITNNNTPLNVQTNNFNFCGYIAVLYFYVNFYFGL